MKTKITNKKYEYSNPGFNRHKFYVQEEQFKGFSEIDENELNKIKKETNFWQQSSNFKNSKNLLEKLSKTFFYVNECIIGTFDEKALFLILSIDPNAHMLQTYELCNTNDEIKDAFKKRFGFYSQKLINLEKAYAEKYLNSKETDWAIIEMRQQLTSLLKKYQQIKNDNPILELKRKSN